MKIYESAELSEEELAELTKRPAINIDRVFDIVKPVLLDIKQRGITAALEYAKNFDGFEGNEFLVSEAEYEEAEKNLDPKVKEALETAAANIKKFHELQKPKSFETETMNGVKCSREFRAIENAGLYVPGGTAILPSTMLMLGIPAKIAGCGRVVVCSPSKDGKINYPLLYAAKLCRVDEFYKIGGAQAIGLMAYGDSLIPKVNKIFGPGNQYVTAAKLLVSIDAEGCSIDMPAGPSEVLVIAGKNADVSFIAADLLSQAEHGVDSQAVLVTDSIEIAEKVKKEIAVQLKELPRAEYASKALENSFVLVTENLDRAVEFSNGYAPEHLIINTDNPESFREKIVNAGSVFLGPYSPESAGDYASGTNHSLPTYGFAKTFGGVTVEAFMKSVTFQNLTKEGLKNIAGAVTTLAETEGLSAHKNAITIRLK